MPRIFRNYLSKTQLAECEHVGALLAPELAGGFYVVNLPVKHPPSPNSYAFASRGRFSFAVYEAIQEAGVYSGQKPAIVFCRRLKREKMIGTLIHELGHLLPWSEPITQQIPSTEQRAEWDGFVAARLTRDFVGDAQTLPAWFQSHGAQWTRIVLHLHARAWHHGLEIGLPEIGLCGEMYDLSPAWVYMRALKPETVAMRDASFAEIDKAPMPAEFSQLFARDFEKWCERQYLREPITQTKKETENVSPA